MAAGPVEALFDTLASLPREACAFVYFDAIGTALGVRHLPFASFDQVELPLRRVVGDVLELSATAVTMAHNHPSGDPTASTADYAVTRHVARGLALLGVRLLDHIILAGDRSFSLLAAGVL